MKILNELLNKKRKAVIPVMVWWAIAFSIGLIATASGISIFIFSDKVAEVLGDSKYILYFALLLLTIIAIVYIYIRYNKKDKTKISKK